MSPILLRPIREQQEHDRIIRQLQARWRRRFHVGINLGAQEEVSVRSRSRTCYPDLVLTNTTGGRRLHGVVEVETAESVNHLEAMAEWSHFAKARGAFYLYVPAGFADVAQRLCEDGQINVTEIWAYYAIEAQAKFSLSYRSPRARAAANAAKARPVAKSARAKPKAKTAKKATGKSAKSSVKKAAKKPTKKPVKKKASKRSGATAAVRAKGAKTRKTSAKAKPKTTAKRAARTSAKRKK